jgi:SAM-dependent methyltransferase
VAARFATGTGEPEDHLRSPFERLLSDLWPDTGTSGVVTAGEAHLADERVRPDYAVFVDDALVGFVEIKAPGKGADPSRFRDPHDRDQWDKLRRLPNVLYTDGQCFGLYRDGEPAGEIVALVGRVESAGQNLRAVDNALSVLVQDFLRWHPVPPRRPRDLALSSARLCRLLRDEVRELLRTDAGLQALAEDWRDLLFPNATDEMFADGYAQTVTFALLLARVENIELDEHNLPDIAARLGQRHTLIGTALDVLTSPHVLRKLASSLRTLLRVLSVVDWGRVSRGEESAWLLFYEEFLQEYDPALRRSTGSYYTPIGVVDPMVRLVDDLLRVRFGRHDGFASPDVTVVDPGCGTGTYLFRIINRIASTIAEQEGQEAVGPRLRESSQRLIGFEIQAGPFAVAELRLTEEYRRLGSALDQGELRLYIANTLDDPYVEDHRLAAVYEPIAQSRRGANSVKKDEPVLVVIGNPPYKERSRRQGGWIEMGDPAAQQPAPLKAFIPPSEWGLSSHVKHLYNPYIYFWRWATWKVFENHPSTDRGIVAFITVAGFLNGPGFAQMRSYLRRTADDIWIIDLSPEGHQPDVPTRVFSGVQQPVCITIALRDGSTSPNIPAAVRHRAIGGTREKKFEQLSTLALDDSGWIDCPPDWRSPFLPASEADWEGYLGLPDLLSWSGSGTMAGRTWVRAPSPTTLRKRWEELVQAPVSQKPALLDEHPQDRTIDTRLSSGLPGFAPPAGPLRTETGPCAAPVRMAFRSFDRQWIIPDKRIINRPNPALWWVRSAPGQIYMTAPHDTSPENGPAVTFTSLVPDLHHYHGRGGRVWPMFLDPIGHVANVLPGLIHHLAGQLNQAVKISDIFAYIAAVAAHPAYTALFETDLERPGVRVPFTTDSALYERAVALGREIIWLHTYGERFADPGKGRPFGPPRLPIGRRPLVLRGIPTTETGMPNRISYDEALETLSVGDGQIGPVVSEAWHYEVSGMKVIRKWFSYRKKEPEGRPSSSELDAIITREWEASWTTELLELINVLTLLVHREQSQAQLLDEIIGGSLVSVPNLTMAGVLPAAERPRPPRRLNSAQGSFE